MNTEPRHEGDYSGRQVEAAHRVLMDVGQVLNSFHDTMADDQVAARPPASDLLSRVQNPDGNWPAFGTTDPREMQDDCALTLEWTNPKMRANTAAGIRGVKLMGPALKVLQTQKTHTVLRNAQVFQNPRTGKRWTSDKAYRKDCGPLHSAKLAWYCPGKL